MADLQDVAVGAGSAAVGAAAYHAWRRHSERDVLDGKPVRLQRVDPRDVKTDADAFQFKSGGDAAGVTDRLKGVTKWNPAAAGKVIVWERADGEQFIADGHQRRGLGERLANDGQHVRLDAYVLRQADGWSPRDVRAYAALKNMHESSGNALDMAKVLRERPDLATGSLPVSDVKIREAKALANLAEPAFRMVVGGAVKPEHAAAVGEVVKDSSRHADMLTEMQKAKVASTQHARLYVSQAMAAPSISETTGSLFGDETQVRSLLRERAAVLDRAVSALKSDKRIFALLEREATNIEAAGNRLAHETNAVRADTSGQMAGLIEKLSTSRGPVSRMLDEAAAAMARGESAAKAARAFVSRVGSELKAGGINRLLGDGAMPQQSMAMVGKPNVPQVGAVYRDHRRQRYTVTGVSDGRVHVEMGRGTKLSYEFDQFHRSMTLLNGAKAAAQSTFLPDATTQEQIAAAAKAKGKPTVQQQGVGGLFGDGMHQTDLVEMAKQPAGWSDAARAASADVRAENAKRGDLAPLPEGRMTLAQMKAYARAHGIPVQSRITAADLAQRIAEKHVPMSVLDRSRVGEATAAGMQASSQRAAIRDRLVGRAASGGHGAYDLMPNGDKMLSKVEVKRRMAAARAIPKSDPTRSLKIEHVQILAGTAWRPDGTAYSPALHAAAEADLKKQQEAAFGQSKRGQRKAKAPASKRAAVDTKTLAADIKALQSSGDRAKAQALSAQVLQMTQAQLRDLVGERNGRMPAKSASKAKLLGMVRGDIAGGVDMPDKEAIIDRLSGKKQSMLGGPRRREGQMTDEAKAQWSKVLEQIPVDEKGIRRMDLTKGNAAGKMTKPPKPKMAMAGDAPKKTRTSGLRGTQNAANREAIIANRQANAKGPEVPGVPNAKRPVDNVERNRKASVKRTKGAIAKMGADAALRTAAISPEEAARRQKAADVFKNVSEPTQTLTRKERAELKAEQKARIASAKAQIAKMSADEPKPAAKPRKNKAKTTAPVSIMGDANKYGSAPGALTQAQKDAMVKKGGPAPSFASVEAAAKDAGVRLPDMTNMKPERLTKYQQGLQAGPRQHPYQGEQDAAGKPTSKSRNQLIAEARKAGIKDAGTTDTRTLAKKLGYSLKYALPVGIAAATIVAMNQSAEAGESTTEQAKAGATTAVAGTAVAAGFIGGTALAVRGLMKAGMTAAKAVPVVGAALMAGGAVHGAITADPGQRLAGAARGAWDMSLPGSIVNAAVVVKDAIDTSRERVRSAGPTRLTSEQAKQFEDAAKSHPVMAETVRQTGWTNAARIAAYQARMQKAGKSPTNAPYDGIAANGPSQWASASTTAEAMKKAPR